MDIKVIVAAHKPYRMPQDSMYLPLQVGRALTPVDFGWHGDNTGDNISLKNPYYCELTGLYWAWKNLKADAIGLVHYRRFFREGESRVKFSFCPGRKWDRVLTYAEAEELLSLYPMILPKKRNYYIETIESQYAHAHNKDQLRLVREIIREYHSDYLTAFDRHMNERSGHMFNMFIMRYNNFNNYCNWLFDILFKLEDILGKNDRIYGFIGERLLDVWIRINIKEYVELNVQYIENQKIIKKCYNFVKRYVSYRLINSKK